MWRTTAVLAASMCAIAACRGGAAQEPYDGVVVTTRGPVSAVPARPSVANSDAEPMASEVDVPWTIALLSDADPAPASAPARGSVVERAVVAEPDTDTDVTLALDNDHVGGKAAAPKACSGVVKGRS